jgi:peptide/nickel transport system ATP-binding protein
MALLAVDNLTIDLPPGLDRAHAVERVSFTLDPREILCVVGESGSGKSITASAIMGLVPNALPISSGKILFEGRDLLALSPEEYRDLRGRRLGMIFQEPMTALNPIMRVGDQIEEVLRVHGVGDRNARTARVMALLNSVGLPEPERLRHAYPFRLSGGQRQRVMIAMALALEPAVLIADEPTTALDVTTQMQILRLIKQIQESRGMGVLFITHDFGVVAEIADRIVVMQNGLIVESGVARQVLDAPQHDYTRSLIAAVPRLDARKVRPAIETQPVFGVRGVDKTFGRLGWLRRGRRVEAVKQANFSLRAGETLGLVGESGSGKSTLARCAIRLIDPDSGAIDFAGEDLARLSRAQMRPYRKRIQMVFQDPYASLNPRKKVAEIVCEGPVTHGESHAQALTRAKDLLRLVGLDPSALDRYPHEFSGGQRQRIGIARALALEPEILVADEPVSALDVSVQAQVLDLLADIRRRLGLTMLFITHDLRVAAQICDTIAVMQRGEIVEYGPTTRVFGTPGHAYTRELLDAIPGKAWMPPVLGA